MTGLIPEKTLVERTLPRFDTATYLNRVQSAFNGRFKGYAVIVTNPQGKRLGFTRQGYAWGPAETGLDPPAEPFTLNVATAIGSVTKLLTTVTVLKSTPNLSRLDTPFRLYLPDRWRQRLHDDFEDVTVRHLLQHRGAFRHSSENNEHVSDRLAGGKEIGVDSQGNPDPGFEAPPYPSRYSNASMGLFHYIYAKYADKDSLADLESDLVGASDELYNEKIQDATSRAYNRGLYDAVIKPLGIGATMYPAPISFRPA